MNRSNHIQEEYTACSKLRAKIDKIGNKENNTKNEKELDFFEKINKRDTPYPPN